MSECVFFTFSHKKKRKKKKGSIEVYRNDDRVKSSFSFIRLSRASIQEDEKLIQYFQYDFPS
jgi:hypothetical protein